MNETVCVYGLWHLGSVTAACVASAGRRVIGLDPDADRVRLLASGEPPVAEPGLAALIQTGLSNGSLSFTTDASTALADATLLWVTFDTPVDEDDCADVAWVRRQIDDIAQHVGPDTLVLVSSQVPVGFTRRLERDWRGHHGSVTFACSPENLRLGQAISVFQQPGRVVIGTGAGTSHERLSNVFEPFCDRLIWMSLESAEMTKHALNSFLALSVVYTNELARLCEQLGADASDVERALRSDPRIGPRAYVAPGPPLAGGTLARDVQILRSLAAERGLPSPLVDAIGTSNRLHQAWTRDRLRELLDGVTSPRVTLLGLTYKPGTDTLRRSSSVEIGQWLVEQGAEVVAFDPAVHALPPQLAAIRTVPTLEAALDRSDAVVVATPWPEFAFVTADQLVQRMRRPRIVDQAGFLGHLGDDPRVTYLRVGRPLRDLISP